MPNLSKKPHLALKEIQYVIFISSRCVCAPVPSGSFDCFEKEKVRAKEGGAGEL